MSPDTYLCMGPHCGDLVGEPFTVCDCCWGHRGHLRMSLAGLWVLAHTRLPPSAPPIDVMRLGGRRADGGTPMRLRVFAAIEMGLTGVVGWAAWVRRVRHEPALPGLGFVPPSALFHQSYMTLARHDDVLADTSMRWHYVDELWRIHRALVEACGEDRDEHVNQPCLNPACQCLTVVSRNGAEYFGCLSCGTRWSQARFLAETAGPTVDSGADLDYRLVDSAYLHQGEVPQRAAPASRTTSMTALIEQIRAEWAQTKTGRRGAA